MFCCFRLMDKNQWIRVDLKIPQLIAGVVTQGQSDANHWVTSYKVSYSLDGSHFVPYIETGNLFPKVFPGNHDRDTPVKAMFDREVRARFVRIEPVGWNAQIAIRFETHSYILKILHLCVECCQCNLTVRHILVECNRFARERKDIFGRRDVVESFRFHPTLIVLFLKQIEFYYKF